MVKPAQQRSRQLAPGDKLGKYDLIRQIAVGGMAELYLARTVGIEGFEKLVVVKRILPQFVTNANFVTMFLNEARLAATLHHPNIAQVYDIGLEDGDYFFAMEYVHGEDLERILATGSEQGVPVSMDVALTLVAGLCSGLHYAHEKAGADGKPLEIVHRDVTPSNVLVSYDGAVKLVDFGIARAMTRPSTTTQGGLKGKIAYMSPEQCRSQSGFDRRSDLFSVGTLLYELTTGRPPFVGETEYQVLDQIVNKDAIPPSQIVLDYPPALEKIVLRALARDVDKRYSTGLQLQGDIEDFAHETRLRVSPLVLARLMSSLFPARLEEWDHAKAQGAFFVEQHVVQTLIESGRTADPNVARASSEESTSVAPLVQSATQVGPPPVATTLDTGRIPTPVPGAGYVEPPRPPLLKLVIPPVGAKLQTPPRGLRTLTPRPQPFVPGMPGAVPIVGGTLVTSQVPPPHPVELPLPAPAIESAPIQVPPQLDVTERVRVPARLETEPVKGKRRWPIVMFALLFVAGGAAALLVTRGGDDAPAVTANPPNPDPPKPEIAKPAEVAKPLEAPKPPEPTPVEPAPVAPVAPAITDTPPTKLDIEPPKAPHKVAHVAPKPRPKPDPKPVKPAEPKEAKPWNADSPFMPVRTDKH